MSMDSDDLNDLAGEYVLGTLAGADRIAFEGRLQRDIAAMRAVALWAQHLQPLADAVTPAIPAPQLWQRIEGQLGLPAPTKRRAPMWIAAAVAAAIVAVAFLFPDLYMKPDVNAVAQLAPPTGGEPAFVVSVLDDQEKLLIRATNVTPQPNNSYELWVVPQTGAPISLGVVQQTGETERDVAETLRPLLAVGGTLAVSLEPVGGSTTGAPTTVIFVGALTPPSE